jgi:DNA-binding response OmpR family regulator
MARILLVDDDPDLREELSRFLEGEGHEVQTDSGEEVMEILGRKDFDIVLSDVVMPAIKGTEILNYVTRNLPQTLVIMITAYGSIEEAVRAMREGASDYIRKPFRAEDVHLSIEKALKEADFKETLKGKVSINGKLLEAITAISNPLRREVIESLSEGKHGFQEITRKLSIKDPPKLSFHLRKLKELGLLAQDQDRRYMLSPFGHKILKILKRLQEEEHLYP